MVHMFWNKKTAENVSNVNLTVNFFEEDGTIVVYCPSLDISTCGADKEEAKQNFQELVGIFFDDLIENDTYHTVLKELGWRPESTQVKSRWMPPKMSQEPVSVKIPVMA